MSDSPLQDAVAIDTNVFEHLLNPQNNIDKHINFLLLHLQEKDVKLLVDDKSRISKEYQLRIVPVIEGADDTGIEIFILRYWMNHTPRLEVGVNRSDELMKIIETILSERDEIVDRILVYVALSQGKILISNDRKHIICGSRKESARSSRRHRLLKESKRKRPMGAGILTSLEAYQEAVEL